MTTPTTSNVKEINRLHDGIIGSARNSFKMAVRLGELLLKEREIVNHGDWEDWLEANVKFSNDTALNYMRLHENRDMLLAAPIDSLTSAYKLLNDARAKNRTVRSASPANQQVITQKLPPAELLQPPKITENIELDKAGWPIPKPLVKIWNRSDEVDEVLNEISAIKCFLEKVEKSKDVLWADTFLDKAIAHLESAYATLTTARPFAVCSICQGHPETQPGECRGCKGKGFMSRFRWDRVPDNIKNIREKAVKK